LIDISSYEQEVFLQTLENYKRRFSRFLFISDRRRLHSDFLFTLGLIPRQLAAALYCYE